MFASTAETFVFNFIKKDLGYFCTFDPFLFDKFRVMSKVKIVNQLNLVLMKQLIVFLSFCMISLISCKPFSSIEVSHFEFMNKAPNIIAETPRGGNQCLLWRAVLCLLHRALGSDAGTSPHLS